MSRKNWLLLFLILFATACAGFFLLRNRFLGYMIGQQKEKILEKTGVMLETESFGFEGIMGIRISGLRMTTREQDTAATINEFRFTISLIRLIKGLLPADQFFIEDFSLNLDAFTRFRSDTTDGHGQEIPDSVSSRGLQNFDRKANLYWNRFLDLADINLRIDRLAMHWRSGDTTETISTNLLLLEQSRFTTVITDSTKNFTGSWQLEGFIDQSNGLVALNGISTTGKSMEIPLLERITEIHGELTSFQFGCRRVESDGRGFMLQLSGSASAPSLHHWRISDDPVSLDTVAVNMNLLFSSSEVIADSGSGFRINKIPVHCYMRWHKSDSTEIAIDLRIPQMDAQEFFNSLPKGLFSTLKGIRVDGRLAYSLEFEVNPDNPDSLHFESSMKTNEFWIRVFGNEILSRINNPFFYSSVENDRVVRTFMVGPENPYFTPFSQIPPILTGAVLIAEDGTFWYHRGFNEESFRQSIATNIREKRFARGGSTITMQLVKNVFLSRDKTISRKIEEAIIVWLIESTRMVSKERMLEVYLNIIEWGPGIYGIGEAAEYYFAKKPSELTLNECIYLSAIIPRPKSFKYTFDTMGMLRPYLKSYFKLVAGRMVHKEIISPWDTVNMSYQVYLTGRARELVVPADTLLPDSLKPEVPELMFEK